MGQSGGDAYSISNALALGVCREGCWLPSGSGRYGSENALESDGGSSHLSLSIEFVTKKPTARSRQVLTGKFAALKYDTKERR
jgi:hypothetical protein